MAGEVDIPVSVPGLVSKQVLVMSYVDGLPITRAQVGFRVQGAACTAGLRPMSGERGEASWKVPDLLLCSAACGAPGVKVLPGWRLLDC